MIKALFAWVIIYMIMLFLMFNNRVQNSIIALYVYSINDKNIVVESVKNEWKLSELEEEKIKNEKKKKKRDK